MILERLQVERFGRFRSESWEFGPGLNVIRGPNEAGKSTMREAIVRLLFDNTNITTTSKKFLGMTTWQSGQKFLLSAAFTAAGQRYHLTKDFERNDIELRSADGSLMFTDNAQVNERLFELLGVQSREVYTTTACLEQQEFAELAAGKEVSELLQQTVTGTGEGVGPQDVIADLDREITELTRGLRHPAKRLGALAASEARIAELTQDIAALKPIVTAAEDAAQKIEQLGQQLSQVETELEQAEALRERADRQREHSAKLADLSERCTGLEQDTRRARELQDKVKNLDEQLAQSPDITPEIAEELRDLARRRDEAVGRAQRRAEDAARLTQDAAEAAQALEEVGAQAPAPGTLTGATRLQTELQQAQELLDDAKASVTKLTEQLEEAQGAARQGMAFVVVGLALAALGSALGFSLHPAFWVLGGVGLGTLVAGFLLRPARAPLDVEEELGGARDRFQQASEAAEANREALQAVYGEAGVADLEELLQRQEATQKSQDRAKAREVEAGTQAQTASGEAETASAQVQELETELQGRLAGLGFDDLASFEQAAEGLASVRQQRSEAQNTLHGILGDRTLADLDQEFSRLNADRLGVEEQLRDPELASAAMTHEQYQELLSRRDRLTTERDRLKDNLNETGRIAERPDSDPERLRSLGEQQAGEQERLEHLEERYEATALARELMEQAQLATMSTAADKLEPTISNLISRLTGGRYAQITVERTTLAPQVYSDQKGEVMDLADEASCATREQVFLAARLALTGLLWPDERPLVLMDDPLVNFDPDRRAAALEMIRALADETQVILFTCQDWYDRAADYLIVL